MATLFNNSRDRNHESLYGRGAFFDLSLHGRQASMARDMKRDAQCVVATPDSAGRIAFGHWLFEKEVRMTDEDNAPVRVFFGRLTRVESMTRAEAVASEQYGGFFNVKGHFKRLSVFAAPRVTKQPNRGE